MPSEELPERLFRTTGPSGKVAHVDGDCARLKRANGVRTLPTEYLRRGGVKICNSCGDGRRLE